MGNNNINTKPAKYRAWPVNKPDEEVMVDAYSAFDARRKLADMLGLKIQEVNAQYVGSDSNG